MHFIFRILGSMNSPSYLGAGHRGSLFALEEHGAAMELRVGRFLNGLEKGAASPGPPH